MPELPLTVSRCATHPVATNTIVGGPGAPGGAADAILTSASCAGRPVRLVCDGVACPRGCVAAAASLAGVWHRTT